MTTEADLRRVQDQIDAVESQIKRIENQLEAERDPGEIQYWREEKKQLREKEKQLREEKNLLLQQNIQPGTVNPTNEDDYLTQLVPSASEFSKDNRQAIRWQLQTDNIDDEPVSFRNGRPLCVNGRCFWKRCPVVLVHPGVGEALNDLACSASELTPEDWAFYDEIVEMATFYHKKEGSLHKALMAALSRELARRGLGSLSKVSPTDGVLIYYVWVLCVEVKRMQGSADLQQAEYYRQSLKEALAQLLRSKCLLPCVALEVVSNELRLGLFWREDAACAARLACVELRRDAGLQERRAGAALLRACLNLTTRLMVMYESLMRPTNAPTLVPAASPAMFRAGLPYALAYDARWQNLKQLSQYRLYSAFDAQHGWVALKLVEHFRPAAHVLWSQRHLTIPLLEARSLGGGFSLLVMQLLRQEDGWVPFHWLPTAMQAACREQVTDLFRSAHNPDGNRRFVHGDARRCNVMAHVSIGSGAQASGSDLSPATLRVHAQLSVNACPARVHCTLL